MESSRTLLREPIVPAIFLFLVAALSIRRFGQRRTDAVDFDVYVINLATATSRMAAFMKRFRKTDLSHVSPIRFNAINGRQLRLENHVTPGAMAEILRAEKSGYRQRHYELTRGAVGCHLSHVGVWNMLLESDKDYAMVCEDDAVLNRETHTKSQGAIEGMPADWDLLLLGYWCVRCQQKATWVEMGRFFGLHCYFIRRSAVAKIKAYCGSRIGQQIDSMLSDMCAEGRLKVYGTPTKLAMQVGTNTSVQMPLEPVAAVDPWLSLPVVLAHTHT